jgi:hypothetical protein
VVAFNRYGFDVDPSFQLVHDLMVENLVFQTTVQFDLNLLSQDNSLERLEISGFEN